jgi:hypothetical protein
LIYINIVIAQILCKKLKIFFIEFIYFKIVNEYNENNQQRIFESIHFILKIKDHIDLNAFMHVMNLRIYDLIINYLYLKNHNVVINPVMSKIWFRPNWYQHNSAKKLTSDNLNPNQISKTNV